MTVHKLSTVVLGVALAPTAVSGATTNWCDQTAATEQAKYKDTYHLNFDQCKGADTAGPADKACGTLTCLPGWQVPTGKTMTTWTCKKDGTQGTGPLTPAVAVTDATFVSCTAPKACTNSVLTKFPVADRANFSLTACLDTTATGSCTVTCATGYYADPVSASLTCTVDATSGTGTLDNTAAPACKAACHGLTTGITDSKFDTSACVNKIATDTCKIKCARGYSGGETTWTCNSGGSTKQGTWDKTPTTSGALPTCTPKMCYADAKTNYADKDTTLDAGECYDVTTSKSTCKIKCKTGYVGATAITDQEATFTCTAGTTDTTVGTLGGNTTAVTCIPQCSKAADTLAEQDPLLDVSVCKAQVGPGPCLVSCKAGYTATAQTYQCTANGITGKLTGTAPTCGKMKCFDSGKAIEVADPKLDAKLCWNKNTEGDCTVKCKAGYLPEGTGSATSTYKCDANGKVTGTAPKCVPLCKAEADKIAAADAKVDVTECATTTSATSCSIKCVNGYYATAGTATYKCSASGVLTGTKPECKETLCFESAKAIDNDAKLNATECFSLNAAASTCKVKCAAGYTGTATTYTCDKDGKVTAATAAPSCVPVCKAEADKLKETGIDFSDCAAKTPATAAETCKVKCMTGYNGTEASYSCDTDGKLKGTKPTCTKENTTNVTTTPAERATTDAASTHRSLVSVCMAMMAAVVLA